MKLIPDSPKAKRIRKLAPHEKFSGFAGFQSGFASTPVKSSKAKGKEREAYVVPDDLFVVPADPPSPPSSPTRPPNRSQRVSALGDAPVADMIPFPSADLDRPPGLSGQPAQEPEPDVQVDEIAQPKGPAPEDSGGVDTPNWRDEVGSTP